VRAAEEDEGAVVARQLQVEALVEDLVRRVAAEVELLDLVIDAIARRVLERAAIDEERVLEDVVPGDLVALDRKSVV